MPRNFCLLLLVASTLAITGCASQERDESEQVSTIPWNRPERWEGQGPLGGMMPGTQ